MIGENPFSLVHFVFFSQSLDVLHLSMMSNMIQ